MVSKLTFLTCPEALYGRHDTDEKGKCRWCKKKVAPGYRAEFVPDPQIKSELQSAYEYYWDPDFGSDKRDIY